MRTNNDIEKAIRTSELASKIVKRITESDDEVIMSEYPAELFNSKHESEISQKVYALDKDRVVARLLTDIRKRQKRQRLKILTLSTSVAAAVIAISFLVWQTPSEQVEMKPSKPIASTEIFEPTLILASGKQLSVEEVLAEQQVEGYTLQKDETGAISYERLPSQVEQETYNTMVVPAKYKSTVILSDGTEVTINACSSLKYPVVFNGDTREVEVNGEAYFKVKKMDKPFIVRNRGTKIKVYGTEFNVNEYNDDIEVVLVTGAVGVSAVDSNKEVMLKPNQKLVCSSDMKRNALTVVDAKKYLGWLSGDFDYRHRPLSELLRDLSRWYDIDFTATTNINNKVISFYAPRASELEDIFNLITRTVGLTFINEGGGEYRIVE